MLDAQYYPRMPRVQISETQASIATESRRLRAVKQEDRREDTLLDLSCSGMKILTHASEPPEVGEVLGIELRHQSLRGTLTLAGRVQWVRDEEEGWSIGVKFDSLRDTTAVALEQFIALELGSAVVTDTGERLGFVSQGPPAALGETRLMVYDIYRAQLAEVMCGVNAFLLSRGDETTTCDDLEDALAVVFQVTDALRVVPPLSWLPALPQES